MNKIEKIITISEKLPGYFGYRPFPDDDGGFLIKEIIFQLEDEEKNYHYIITLFFEKEKCVEGIIDIKFDDGSIMQIANGDDEFSEVIQHKDKIINLFNNLK